MLLMDIVLPVDAESDCRLRDPPTPLGLARAGTDRLGVLVGSLRCGW